MANKYKFESSLEKIARAMSSMYNVNIVFEGEQAKTDGKTIFLPFIKTLDEQTKMLMNGYLDHEVGHVKFTDFDICKSVKSRFLFDLINATEDYRIERRMMDVYPGTYYNLKPMNDFLIAQVMEKLETYPWPLRLIITIAAMMEDRPVTIDEEITDYVDYVEEFIDDLRASKSTKETKEICELIYKRVLDKLKEKEEEAKGKGEKGEGEGEGEMKEHLEEAKSLEADSMSDKKLAEESKKHVMSIHDLMDKKIEEKLESEAKIPKATVPEIGTGIVIPLTTRFDKVTDQTAKGSPEEYHKLRASIMHIIGPIKRHLERVLKVKENARWQYEKERGKLNPSAFINLRTQVNYRRPFKELTRTETKNVVIEILVDLSGSMGGEKIKCARLTTIAMAESLKDLGINFEVTGFNSTACSEMRTVKSSGVHSGRTSERLDLHVFKDFGSDNLVGLTKIFSGHNNPDGECVAWAAKRLLERHEKRKILIVLSDGQPNTGDTDDRLLRSDLKIKIEKIMKSGVDCVGFGILTDSVKYYYPEYVIVNDINKLASEAMTKLSAIIRDSKNA